MYLIYMRSRTSDRKGSTVPQFLKTSAYLILTIATDAIVRISKLETLALTIPLLDISVVIALVAYVAQHGADYLELVLASFTRLFGLVCGICVSLRWTLHTLRISWQHPELAANKPCVCGSGKQAKNCHLKITRE